MSTLNSSLLFENVGVTVGQQPILSELNLELEGNQIYTLIGPSGTGKSTLLKLVAGLLPASSGRLLLGGESYDPTNHKIGLVPQNYGLLPWQTTWQALSSALKISSGRKKLTSQDEAKLNYLLGAMALTELKDAYPNEMSGGQQQRVSISRAFAIEGDLLLMDEPFSALDAFTREKAQQLFLDTWKKEPKTTLFITHDIEEAILLGDKLLVMAGQPGKIIKVVDNQLKQNQQSITEIRDNAEFYLLVQQLRKELQRNEGTS